MPIAVTDQAAIARQGAGAKRDRRQASKYERPRAKEVAKRRAGAAAAGDAAGRAAADREIVGAQPSIMLVPVSVIGGAGVKSQASKLPLTRR